MKQKMLNAFLISAESSQKRETLVIHVGMPKFGMPIRQLVFRRLACARHVLSGYQTPIFQKTECADPVENGSEWVCKQLKYQLKNQSTEGSAPLELCFSAKTEVGHFVSVLSFTTTKQNQNDPLQKQTSDRASFPSHWSLLGAYSTTTNATINHLSSQHHLSIVIMSSSNSSPSFKGAFRDILVNPLGIDEILTQRKTVSEAERVLVKHSN
jgi:hypothetical protein